MLTHASIVCGMVGVGEFGEKSPVHSRTGLKKTLVREQ